MLHAGIEALFGRNRDHHQKEDVDEFSTFFADKPNTEKFLQRTSTFAVAAMQGWRSTMEDTHKHLIPFDNRSWRFWSFFTIFDGNNGEKKNQNVSFFKTFRTVRVFGRNQLVSPFDFPLKNITVTKIKVEFINRRDFFHRLEFNRTVDSDWSVFSQSNFDRIFSGTFLISVR
jgi:serine/threonine protein phosphatase PrpC